jgi:hypothetical protein
MRELSRRVVVIQRPKQRGAHLDSAQLVQANRWQVMPVVPSSTRRVHERTKPDNRARQGRPSTEDRRADTNKPVRETPSQDVSEQVMAQPYIRFTESCSGPDPGRSVDGTQRPFSRLATD